MNRESPIIKPLLGLLQSRKALVMLVLNVTLLTLFLLGKLKWEQVEKVITWVNAAWLGSHAVEEGLTRVPSPED